MTDKYIPLKPHMETIKKTAELFGVSEYFVRKKALAGEIVAVRISGRILVNCDKFAEYLNTATLKNGEEAALCTGIRQIKAG
jgi:hypothetical protein